MTWDNVLLLLHPGVASDPQRLIQVKGRYDDDNISTSQQMLDRLAVDKDQIKRMLPENHFKLIDIVAPRQEQEVIIPKQLFNYLYQTLVPGGKIIGQIATKQQNLDAIMAGFTPDNSNRSWVRPVESMTAAPVSLKVASNGNKRNSNIPKFTREIKPILKNNSHHDLFDDSSDDELIDENDLVQDSISKPIILPQKCVIEPGKRRRKPCKDCTCGLKDIELQQQDDQIKLQDEVILNQDLKEVDFTIPGKSTGSCGSCSLGDAFRCDGCPYLGLPPFKPGQVVSLAGLAQDDV